jgi:Skp family chaperone for outer membrane proteins
MKHVAAIGTALALAAGIAGCGAQHSIEHAATSASHAVEEGQKAKKELERDKVKIESEVKEFERKSKAARAAFEREKGKSSG